MTSTNRREIKGLAFAYVIALLGTILANETFILKDRTDVLKHVVGNHFSELYFVWFDFFPAFFLFLNGFTMSISLRQRRMRSTRLLVQYSRRGLILFFVGLLFVKFWPMNLLVICGLCYFSAPFFAKWDENILRAFSLMIILFTMVLTNLDFPIFPMFETFDLEQGIFSNLIGFVFFNGYYSFFPWIAFFVLGVAMGKGDLKIRGWLPPVSIVALIIVGVSVIAQRFLNTLYGEVPEITDFTFNAVVYRMYGFAFAILAIGLILVVFNLINYFAKRLVTYEWGEKIWSWVNDLSKIKYSLYTLVMFFTGILFLVIKAGNQRIYWFRPIAILIPFSVALLVLAYIAIRFWQKKVNISGPIEWLLKSITSNKK